MVQKITTVNAPKPAGQYSQAVRAGDFIYVAGQGPITKDGEIERGTIAEQTALTLENIKVILEEAGASPRNIIRVSVHLSELNEVNFREFNGAYNGFFQEPLPTRITVGSQLLNIDVEIEVIAYVGN